MTPSISNKSPLLMERTQQMIALREAERKLAQTSPERKPHPRKTDANAHRSCHRPRRRECAQTPAHPWGLAAPVVQRNAAVAQRRFGPLQTPRLPFNTGAPKVWRRTVSRRNATTTQRRFGSPRRPACPSTPVPLRSGGVPSPAETRPPTKTSPSANWMRPARPVSGPIAPRSHETDGETNEAVAPSPV